MLESRMLDIAANLERVRERVARAAERAGRRPDDVLLIGVSKVVEVERIRAALAAGIGALGENRVQEAKAKIGELGRPVPWHLIGHLQTNKVKDALPLFDLIQSLDRLELAQELERRAAAQGRVIEALLQVNVASEASKGGFAPDAVGAALDTIGALPHVQIRGLMAIPPEAERPEDARAVVPAAARAGRQARAARAFDGDERRFRGGHRRGRDHGPGRHRDLRPAPVPPIDPGA